MLNNGQLVPCGKCINCRRKRIADWRIKIFFEYLFYENKGLFCTFTYSDKNLPAQAVLDYADFQKFFKRLRRRFTDIRYFCCEEYGSKFGRPHFHAIILGIDPTEPNIDKIDNCWGLGHTDIQPLKLKNIGYVAKYCVKQFAKFKTFFNSETGECVEKIEKIHWSSGSQKGGLGWRYFYTHMSDILNRGFIMFQGFKYSIPRGFRQKLAKVKVISNLVDKFFAKKKDIYVISTNLDYDFYRNYLTRFFLQPKVENRDLSLDQCIQKFDDLYNINFVDLNNYRLLIDKNAQAAKDYAVLHNFDFYQYEAAYPHFNLADKIDLNGCFYF